MYCKDSFLFTQYTNEEKENYKYSNSGSENMNADFVQLADVGYTNLWTYESCQQK